MKTTVLFNYQEHALISDDELCSLGERLKKDILYIKSQISAGYATDYASIALPSDQELLADIQQEVNRVKALNPTMLIVIGIGGSHLGTAAVVQALYGTYYNAFNPDISFYTADTLDTILLKDLLLLAQRELDKGNSIVLTIVSKSGTTTETLANATVFFELLKKYYPNTYTDYCIVITDKDSPLWKSAHNAGFSVLEIPEKVGGRYSVLSAVSLFPLAMLGIDIISLRKGAHAMRQRCLETDIALNYAAQSACITYFHYMKSINIHDIFLFSPYLLMFGNWYRQLVGESLGKKHNRAGKVIEAGITPTVSIGTTDLHSLAQLYLGGPRDKITTFVYITNQRSELKIGKNVFSQPVPALEGKTIYEIKDAIFRGVEVAYAQEGRPYMTLLLPEMNEYVLGQCLMFCMLEVMFLASLLEINAFDQPAVELYKNQTRKLLNNG